MAKTATLTVKIVSDAKGAAKGFADAESRVDKFRGGMGKASAAVGVAAGALVVLGKQAFDSASRLQQAGGAVESVFGAQADAVKRYATDAAQAVGLANSEYSELASVLGSQLKNMGTAAADLAPKTNDLIKLGADLAATYGGTTSDAVSALSSLLRGERDPIERYGVSIKQADIDARLAAEGHSKLTGEAKKAAEAQALMAILTGQTSAALGAFNREADTAAGQTQRASAEFENAKAALGEALLPIVTVMAEKLAVFAQILAQNKDIVIPLIAGFAALAAIIWLVNIALYANPIVLIIAAIGVLIGILFVAYQRFEGFRNAVDAIGRFLARVFDPFISVIRNLVNDIRNAGSAWDVFKAIASAAINTVLAPIKTLLNYIKEVGKGIGSLGSWVGKKLFGAPLEVNATDARTAPGLFGAAEGAGAWAPIRGAAMSPSSGGTSPSAGRGSSPTIVNITVNGALDPQAVGDQIAGILRRRGVTRGMTPVVTL